MDPNRHTVRLEGDLWVWMTVVTWNHHRCFDKQCSFNHIAVHSMEAVVVII